MTLRTIALALMSPLLVAQQVAQPPRFGASTSVVRLEVNVTDARGPVRGLRAEDFVVVDNGVVVQPVSVDETSDVPLDLVLVVPPLSAVTLIAEDKVVPVSAGISAVSRYVEPRDRASVLLAGAPPSRLREFVFGPPDLDLSDLAVGTDSAPFDAIAAGLGDLTNPTPARRRALVAFTNAVDPRSTVSFEQLMEAVRRVDLTLVLFGTHIRVHHVVHGQARKSGGGKLGPAVQADVADNVFPDHLRQLAKRTGGLAVDLGEGDPAASVADTLRWLRTRYVLSYTPAPGKGWHQVGVSVKRRGVMVDVREGYWVNQER